MGYRVITVRIGVVLFSLFAFLVSYAIASEESGPLQEENHDLSIRCSSDCAEDMLLVRQCK